MSRNRNFNTLEKILRNQKVYTRGVIEGFFNLRGEEKFKNRMVCDRKE